MILKEFDSGLRAPLVYGRQSWVSKVSCVRALLVKSGRNEGMSCLVQRVYKVNVSIYFFDADKDALEIEASQPRQMDFYCIWLLGIRLFFF